MTGDVSILINVFIWLAVAALIGWLIIYLVDQLPVPAVAKQIARVVVIVLLLILVLTRLLPIVVP